MINCFKDPIDVLMSVFLSSHDAHEEVVDHVNNDDVIAEEGIVVDANGGDTLTLRRSSLRRDDSNSTDAKKKKKVQWVDVIGIKELAEIREFEPSEEDDIEYGRGKTCVCVIL